ncbi:hypothetical protein PIROE2DRAFT_60735 [Piromyces sp. E2]|nr:hypothetical protein PIROE2DRAFT_60735 [Piromyces sp. E2]|eukprot:OUM64313.1 hypothetical protein PIROE2DRAFT_60735 [Piromyces sp. E2]
MDIEELHNEKRKYDNLEDDDFKEQPIQEEKKRRRGPKIGFIHDKINIELKKILEESDVPCEIKNGEVVVKDNEETPEEFIEKLTVLYQKYLNSNKIKKKKLSNYHNVISLNDFEMSSNPVLYNDIFPEKLNKLDDTLIEFKDDYIHEVVPIDLSLIYDFFKYSFSLSLIINPGVLLMKIRNKVVMPALLFAIYASAYLFRPNFNKEKSNNYIDKMIYCLKENINVDDIQNLQAAYIVANLGTIQSYIWSGYTIRALKVFNSYYDKSKNNNDMKNIMIEEYLSTYYTFINIDLLLNLTCNCMPERLTWFNQPIPKNLTERFFLFEKHPFEKVSIKYFVITNFLVKVFKHIRNRRNGVFNTIEFKKLYEESEKMVETLKEDFDFIQNHEFKSQLQPQFYFYLIFYMARLLLFNMELSPYVYHGKLSPSKKYIKVNTMYTEIEEYHLDNPQSHSSSTCDNKINSDDSTDVKDDHCYNDNFSFSLNCNADFKRRYQDFCILEKIKYPGFNYKLYDESEKIKNDDNDDTQFLEIFPSVSDINYKKCYQNCYETAEKATLFLKEINKELAQPRIYYPFYLCIVFYHIGLFYMIVYANFKEEKVKDTIEFYDEQIKLVGPKIGFICDKINTELKKILEESDIRCEVENGEVIIKTISNVKTLSKDKKSVVKESEKSKVNKTESKSVNKNNEKSIPHFEIIKKLAVIYQKHLKSTEIKNKKFLNGVHNIFSVDDFKISNNPLFYNIFLSELEKNEDSVIEYKDDHITEIVPVDYNLISDFFNYAFVISLIINPGILLMKIKHKIIVPALIFSIYACAYLYRPNSDKEKFIYYVEKTKYCLSKSIHIENIQYLQAAFILSNIVPGTIDSYIWGEFTIRALKLYNFFDSVNGITEDIIIKEYVDSYYTYINSNLLLNLTSNCMPNHLNWFNQAIPKSLNERFFLFEKHPLEKLTIKYLIVTNFLAKVIKHIRNRRNIEFNIKEFKKLFEESKNIVETLREDLDFIQNNEYKNKLEIQLYFYLVFYMAKLLLFNMELSPYVYNKKISPLKKYIKVNTVFSEIEFPFDNVQSSSGYYTSNPSNDDDDDDDENDNDSYSFNNNDSNFDAKHDYNNASNSNLTSNYGKDFKRRYQDLCLLEKIKYSGFNYKLYHGSEKTGNDDDDTQFLKIPPSLNDVNYGNCYRICYETAEKATLFLKEVNRVFVQPQPRVHYPQYLCIVFYHIGLFYMLVYVNFKEERVKEKIEFYHEQIKIVGNYYSYVSFYFSKTYEKAKREAYEAFSDDSLVFCPTSLYNMH